jgi:hypothetical protein
MRTHNDGHTAVKAESKADRSAQPDADFRIGTIPHVRPILQSEVEIAGKTKILTCTTCHDTEKEYDGTDEAFHFISWINKSPRGGSVPGLVSFYIPMFSNVFKGVLVDLYSAVRLFAHEQQNLCPRICESRGFSITANKSSIRRQNFLLK